MRYNQITTKATQSSNQSTEVEALRAQVARLQAEKNDLVAMNSELQLKAEQDSRDDSFIEIIKVSVRCKHTNKKLESHSYVISVSLRLALKFSI